MTIESVAAVPALSGYPAATRVSRPVEVTPDAREAVRQESDARRVAESVSGASPAYLSGPDGQPVATGVGTRAPIVAVPVEAQGALETAKAAISRAWSEGDITPEDLRSAADAYRAEAAARDDLARRQRENGLRGVDISV
jgi:hypothetical protein